MLGDWGILAADDTPNNSITNFKNDLWSTCSENTQPSCTYDCTYIWLYIYDYIYMIIYIYDYIYNYASIHTLYHHVPHSNGNFTGYPPFSDKIMYGNIPDFLTYSLCWKSQIWQLSIARIHNWFELQSLLCRSAKHQGTKRTFWHFATENCDELVIENLLICRIQWSKDNQGIWFRHVGFSSPSHIRQVGYLKILR